MIANGTLTCPNCFGGLKYYDKVRRLVRTKGRVVKYIQIRRFKCVKCGAIHREIPENIFSYKHYEAEVIRGVLEGLITSQTLGFEDYPCEMTLNRWRKQGLQTIEQL